MCLYYVIVNICDARLIVVLFVLEVVESKSEFDVGGVVVGGRLYIDSC